jgi:hypothetical protein
MPNVLDLKHPEPTVDLRPERVVAEQIASAPGAAAEQFLEMSLSALAPPEPIEWDARHSLSDKGRYRQYLVFAGFTLVGGIVSWWQASWFTFLTIMLGLAAWELHERLGKPVRIRIDERGVSVNGHQYAHAELTSFHVQQMPDGAMEVSFATRRWHSPSLRLPLGAQDPALVRASLLQYVAEESHAIPLIDRLIRRE